MKSGPLTQIDFYKADHRRQYPPGTTMVYSNFTPRSDKLCTIPEGLWTKEVTFFGMQYFIEKYLIECWQQEFFSRPKAQVIEAYKRRMDWALGPGAIPIDHIEELHDLGYLPLAVKSLPEGSAVPIGVPCLVLYNTHPKFFWLTNYIESVLSCYLWKPITSATVARHYRILLERFAKETGAPSDFVKFQAHDFSFRGMSLPGDGALSGAAHLTSFVGTDTVCAIDLIEDYYNGNVEKELIGCSVPATEHSVMCMGTKDNEVLTIRRLITELYPKGIVSVVSDTWDFWKVVTEYASVLKSHILMREGKVVFRPDSGDPVKIICGDKEAPADKPAFKGAVELLWDTFGGTTVTGSDGKEYKILDQHVGLIYGDSITLDRATRILQGLKDKGFASCNIVFGVGSYTYQYVTRDTFGFAVKSTYGEIDGIGQEIFKDPVTDGGVKKSARGLLHVFEVDGKLTLKAQASEIDHPDDHLRYVYKDGTSYLHDSIANIRDRVTSSIHD